LRRAWLKKGVALALAFSGIPASVRSAEPGPKKAKKAVLAYQDEPRNGKSCAGCWAYVAGAGAGEGTCKAVEGMISPNGWCMAYSPRRIAR
jgi:hypothetical protein